jgi:hypothetical protein
MPGAMSDTSRIGFDGLAALAYELPPAIVRAAAAGRDRDLASEFREYPELGVLDFGNRLVVIAALTISALYIDALRRNPSAKDPLLQDYLRTMLAGRGLDRGLACSVIHRAGVLKVEPFGELVEDDSAVTDFIMNRPAGAGNIFRSQIDESVESQLARLILHLQWLKLFDFDKSGGVSFTWSGETRRIDVWPFLLWDGEVLQRFVEYAPNERGLVWITYNDGEDIRQPPRKPVHERRNQLRATMALVGCAPVAEPLPEAHYEESVIPLFAETHPYMDKLAQRLFEESQAGTQVRLWIGPFLQLDPRTSDKADAYINDQVLVTNAIIKKCMDTDPVTVMMDFLEAEPEDEYKFFKRLLGDDPRRIKQAQDEVDATVTEYADRQSLYCRPQDEAALQTKRDAFRRRRVAQKMVQLMGFQLVEQKAQDDIDDYAAQVGAFLGAVSDRSTPPLSVAGGLVKCAAIAEEILTFLIAFYTALKYYDGTLAEGLDEHRIDSLGVNLAHSFDRVNGLGGLIPVFRDLAKDPEITDAVKMHLGRESIWPEGLKKYTDVLHALKDYRNKEAHEVEVLGIKRAPETVKRFLSVLEWLRDPLGRGDDAMRIYPAILQLNTITMNHCGITSIKHNLTTRGASRPITLYTRQPLSVYAGTFYGLPQRNKALKDLWLDPVLVPTRIFSTVLPKRGKQNAR